MMLNMDLAQWVVRKTADMPGLCMDTCFSLSCFSRLLSLP